MLYPRFIKIIDPGNCPVQFIRAILRAFDFIDLAIGQASVNRSILAAFIFTVRTIGQLAIIYSILIAFNFLVDGRFMVESILGIQAGEF